jgi:hypothetical protein
MSLEGCNEPVSARPRESGDLEGLEFRFAGMIGY